MLGPIELTYEEKIESTPPPTTTLGVGIRMCMSMETYRILFGPALTPGH